MNKTGLVGQVANRTGLTKRASREAVDAIISAITDSLARKERVTLVGFGSFQVIGRKARKGVNPQTREAINIPTKKMPKFMPGKKKGGIDEGSRYKLYSLSKGDIWNNE